MLLQALGITLAMGAYVLDAHTAHSQDPSTGSGQVFPSKPVRLLAGERGGGDFASRQIAQGLTGYLGQPVIVENRGLIGAEMVAKAPPDGHTLLFYGSAVWISPLLRSVNWDPIRDFAAVTWAIKSPNILVVHPALPVRSVKDLVALAKARPNDLNYSSGQSGASSHLAAELFKSMARVNFTRVPYRSAGVEINDLVSGQVQLTFGSAGSVGQHVKSGRLRPLAVTTAEPSVLFPGVPTVAASGVPGYEAAAMSGVFVPVKTPAALINRLNVEIVKVLRRDDVKERFLATGVETVGSTPEEFAAKIKSEMVRLGKVIKDAGIRED